MKNFIQISAIALLILTACKAEAPQSTDADPPKVETAVVDQTRAAEIKQAAMDLFAYQDGKWNARWDWYGPDGTIAGTTQGREEFSPLVDAHSQMLYTEVPAQNQTSYAMLTYNEVEQKIIFLNAGPKGDYWIMRMDPETGTMISDPHKNPDGSEMIIKFTTLRQVADEIDVQMETSTDNGQTWTLAFKQFMTRAKDE
ncbi:MAG: hypothetical protein HKN36_10590 [Hellea sp.]|nr:hypothetical protein [Hellea sp.]